MVKEGVILAAILISTMIAGTGAQFIIDMIQAISTPMYQIFEITTDDLNLIYSAYNALNLFFAPFGGYLILKIGIGNSAVLFSSMIFIGIFIGNFGAYYAQWIYFQAGWSIIGIGIESLINTQVSTCNKWFSGRFLSFSIGLKFAFSIMIAGISDYVCPELYLKFRNIQTPFFAAALCGFGGFLAAAVLNLIDYKYEDMAMVKSKHELEEEEEMKLMGRKEEKKKANFKIIDVFKLSSLYWISISIYCFQFNLFAQFLHIVTDLSVKRFQYEYEEAKNFSVYYKIGVLVSLPIVSFIVGKVGKKSLLLAFSSFLCLASYVFIYLLPSKPSHLYIGALLAISLSYATYISCIWPSLSVTIPRSALSFGFGIASSGQMLAGAIFPFIVGKLSEGRTVASYEKVLYFLCGLSLVCIVFAVILVILDLRMGKVLWLPDNSPIVLEYRERLDKEFQGNNVAASSGYMTGLGESERDDTLKNKFDKIE